MYKPLEDIFFDDTYDCVEHIEERLHDNEEAYTITVVAKFDKAQELLKYALANEELSILSLDIGSIEYTQYWDEYYLCFSIEDGKIEFSCDPAYCDGCLVDAVSDEIYILDDCNSNVIKHCNGDMRYLVILGDNEYEEKDEAKPVQNGVNVIHDDDKNIHGFEVNENNGASLRSFSYYTTKNMNKDDVFKILKENGF